MGDDVKLNVTVPEHQRDIYDEEAREMGFTSRSAYVRAMVNAGRRDFGLNPKGLDAENTTLADFIEDRIVTAIENGGGVGRDEVVDEVAGDIEATVTECLGRLDETGQIDYDIKRDGLVVREDGD